jgi:membrane fusion protein (multidrug efflux system)
MRKLLVQLSFLIFLLQACGEKGNSLEEKKNRLSSLKEQAAGLQNEIKKLEDEIASLDTTLAEEGKVKQVLLTTVGSSEFRHFVSVQGMLESEENLMVSAKMPGMVRDIRVKEGDMVRKGQVLASLDDEVLKKSIDEVKAGLDQVKVLFEKQKSLWDQKIGTELQYLTLKNQKESLEIKLRTLEAQVGQAVVTAPFSGVIDAIFIKPGSMAAPGVPLMQLVNTGSLKASAKVPDSYVSFIKQGDRVLVNFPDLNKEVEASVSYVGRIVDPLSRTFKIEVNIPSGDPGLKPNLLAMVRINDKTLSKAIVIDENIIQPTESGKLLFVAGKENGKSVALQRIVTTGVSYNGRVQIVSGLEEGDQLITTGYQDLSDKQAIRY